MTTPASGAVAPASGAVAPASGAVAPASGTVAPASGTVGEELDSKKPVTVKPAVVPLKQDTNLPWQVYAIGAIGGVFILRWALARWKERTAKRPPARQYDSTNQCKKLLLKSCDGEIFEIEIKVAKGSETIKQVVGNGFADWTIPFYLPNITSKTLEKIKSLVNLLIQPCLMRLKR